MNNSAPFPPGSRLVAYCRDSGGREQDVSVDRQKAEISAWAREHALAITRWFEDRARSGGSTQRRDAFLELNDYLSEPRSDISGVVIWEYARFARQFDDAVFYVASLRRLGFAVYSITDAIPDTLEGRLLESILAWKNAKYREDLSRAVRSGMRLVVSSFKGYPNRTPPIGYRKEFVTIGTRRDGTPHRTAHLVPDPETAPLVQQAFDLRASGATYSEIHNRLHLTAWHISLNRILSNPIYTGTLKFGGNEYPGFCTPLVSAETFARAQSINALRARRFGTHHPRRARSRFILTGLLTCGLCGAPMNGRVVKRAGQKDALYYVCRKTSSGKAATCRAPSLPKDQIETLVLEVVEKHLLHPELRRALLARALKRKRPAPRDLSLKKQKAELAKLDSELRRLVAAIRDSGHSRALLDELAALETRRDALAAQIDSASRADSIRIGAVPNASAIRDTLALLADKLRSSDPTDQTTVLRGLVSDLTAQREGGSATRHRGGPITGEITLLLPVSDEKLIVPL